MTEKIDHLQRLKDKRDFHLDKADKLQKRIDRMEGNNKTNHIGVGSSS